MKSPFVILLSLALGFAAGYFWASPAKHPEVASCEDAPIPQSHEQSEPQASNAVSEAAPRTVAKVPATPTPLITQVPLSSTSPTASPVSAGNPSPAKNEGAAPAKSTDTPPPAEQVKPGPEIVKAENKREERSDVDGGAMDKLDQIRVTNLADTIQISNAPTSLDDTTAAILGVFQGNVYLEDGSGVTWGVYISNQGRIVKGVFRGKSQSRLLLNGRPFLNSTWNGALNSIQTSATGSTTFLYKFSDTIYMQAFYAQDQDMIYGNFYQKDNKGNYNYKGFGRLMRLK